MLQQHTHNLDRVNDLRGACNSTYKVIAESVLERKMEVPVDCHQFSLDLRGVVLDKSEDARHYADPLCHFSLEEAMG